MYMVFWCMYNCTPEEASDPMGLQFQMVVTCHVGPGNWIQDSGRAASALHQSGLHLFVFERGTHYGSRLAWRTGITSGCHHWLLSLPLPLFPSSTGDLAQVLCKSSTLSCPSLEQHPTAHKSSKNSLLHQGAPSGTLASFSVALGSRKD